MEKNTIAFVLWCILGSFYIFLAVYIWFSKKAIAFWGSAKMFEVTDIRKYNHAMSKLYSAYGITFILLGLPLLLGHFECILLSAVGVVMETIVLIIVYSFVIKKKYSKKKSASCQSQSPRK